MRARRPRIVIRSVALLLWWPAIAVLTQSPSSDTAVASSELALARTLPPCPTRWFSDLTKVTAPTYASELDRRLERFEHDTTNQFLVVLVPKLPPGAAVDDYCKRLFNAWGVGRKGKNNGVILFVLVDDHQLRIEVGRGLEATLTNPVCQEIANTIAARFRTGDYEGGIKAGVEAIISNLQK